MARVGDGVGLIETIRVRGGRIPWLERHLGRLKASLAVLGLPGPSEDLAVLARAAAGGAGGDRVVRLEVRKGATEVTTRAVGVHPSPVVVVSDEPHAPYSHKTTAREQFGRAFAAARRMGADDALLLTQAGYVAEGTVWNLFWWEGTGNGLCTPATELGVLPGIGRGRVIELATVREVRAKVSELAGRSLFLVNAVRGIVEIGTFHGSAVLKDPRTAELSRRFWPD